MRFVRGTFPAHVLGPYNNYFLDGRDIQMVNVHKDLGILVDTSLRFHMHVRSVVNGASGLAANLLRATVCRSSHFMLSLFTTHIRPLLEYCSCLWNTGYICDLRLLESVQRSWTKKIDGMQDHSYKHRLTLLNLYSIKGRLIRADLIKCWKIFHSESFLSPEDLFIMAPYAPTRGHRYKIAHQHSSIDYRTRFFSLRCAGLWNNLPDSVVSLNSLSAFKSALHSAIPDILFDFED